MQQRKVRYCVYMCAIQDSAFDKMSTGQLEEIAASKKNQRKQFEEYEKLNQNHFTQHQYNYS